MALRTKTQVRTAIQNWADDTAASHWTAAQLDLTTAIVYDELWAEVLEMAPRFNSFRQAITITLPSPGYIDIRPQARVDIDPGTPAAIRLRNTFIATVQDVEIPIAAQQDVFTATTHDIADPDADGREAIFIVSVDGAGALTITKGSDAALGASSAPATPGGQTLVGQFRIAHDGTAIFNATTDSLLASHLTFTRQEIAGSPGHLTRRLHRVQELIRNGRQLKLADPKDLLVTDDTTLVVGPQDRFWFNGDRIYMSAGSTSSTSSSGFSTTDDVEIRYSFYPIDYDDLLDAEHVLFPGTHIGALVYETAARSFAKGNHDAPGELKRLAAESRASLRSYIKRRYPGPKMVRAEGAPRDWGGID